MTRLERRNDDFETKGCGGLLDAFDDMIKELWRVNNKQFDHICEHATNEDLDILASPAETFSDKRRLLQTLQKYVI